MIEVPAQLILFSFPALLYWGVAVRKGRRREEVFSLLGLRGSPGIYYVYGLFIWGVLSALFLLTIAILPSGYAERPGLSTPHYSGMALVPSAVLLAFLREALYVALGEEVLFRGLIAGWAFERFGYQAGNVLQTTLFFLPHLATLTAGLDLWPLLVFPLVAGWSLGWLRYRSGSIFPGWLAHSLANTIAAVAVMHR